MAVPVETPAQFPSATAWSAVIGAADRNSPGWKTHLEFLTRRYWKPVRTYLVRRWRCSPEDAADLAQEFFATLLEKDVLTEARPERGKFRTFLKLKLRDLVLHDLQKKAARKRGGGARILSLDAAPDARAVELESPGASPEEAFDRSWAASLLASALERLEQKLKSEGRETVFLAFWNCAVASPPKSYRQCAEELGLKVNDVGNFVFRARKELRRILLEEVRASIERSQEAEEELEYLLGLLEE